jgi:signal transduction histidine kinase
VSNTSVLPPSTARGPVATAFFAVFAPGSWLATVHLMTGMPIGIITFAVTITLLSVTAGLAVTAVLAIGTALILLVAVRWFTALQRSRFRALLGVEIPAVRERHDGTLLRALFAELRSGTTWRQIAYHLLALPFGLFGFLVVTAAWSAGLAGASAVIYGWTLPSNGIRGWNMRSPLTIAVLTIAGLLLLVAAPYIARTLAELDVAVARALLGPSRAAALSMRMESLTRSRADVVDAADAERRRIERDLHDGTQQRLVSLAMNLGMARTELTDASEPARQAIAQAHDEAKQALVELRDFVRGLHPAVLDDRGLDAALSGIIARAPLPVRLHVDVPRRCSPTIEAIAYFVVSESLTNIAKHAHATGAEVTVERIEDRLRIRVSDDGRGGATTETGSGLRGLAQRAASVDGVLRIQSPPGGPTEIVVELPCES